VLERSVIVSARRNVPGHKTVPVLLLVELLRWQRDYDCTPGKFREWITEFDAMHTAWLDWHAEFYGWIRPTVEATVLRRLAAEGAGDG